MANEKKIVPEKRPTEGRETAAEQNRKNRRERRHTGEVADWESADAELIKRCILNVGASGCSIQFGYTRDGSSMVIRIVGDGEPFNEYVRPSEDIDLYLTGLADDYR